MYGLSNASSITFTSLAANNGTYPKQLRFLSTPLLVFLAFVSFLIVASNGFIIYLICKKKTLRSITNMFLTSLAFSDLISGMMGLPLLSICTFRGFTAICVSSVIFIRFTAISSVCHGILIAFDRYIAIVLPLRHPSLVTKRRAILATIFVWMFSFAASFIQLSWYRLENTALTKFEDETESIDVTYSKVCIAIFVVVPLMLMCFIYGHIFCISFKHIKTDRRLSDALRQEHHSFLHKWRGNSVLFIMVVIFAGCWLPFFLSVLADHSKSTPSSRSPKWVGRLLSVLRFIPPLSNPLLCTLSKHDFRCAIKAEVFRRIRKRLSFECREPVVYL